MSRIRRNRKERVRLFEKSGGRCHICEQLIQAGQAWDLEHIKAVADGGGEEDDNLGPAHIKCHRPKTSAEATVRAKTRRMHANHIGASGPGRGASPLPCGRRSNFKKTLLNGVVIRRSQSEMFRELMRGKFGREI